jgi:phospholipid/cholesterol/gamma-HCH transport system substrate-binding protein
LTAPRAAAVGALLVAVAVVAWLLLRGDRGMTYKLRFENAGQLVRGDDVQIGGRRVGSVHDIELTDDNQAEIDISVQDGYAPLHEGTTALIRATSLSGIANRYIALTPGPNSNRELPEGARLGTDETTSIVDLDQLFDTLDPKTLASLQGFIQGSAQWYDNRGRQANAATKYFNPAISSTSALVNELANNQQTLNAFLRNSSKTVGAIAERRDDLANLVSNANATASAIGDENVSLDQALAVLPGTLRKANTTFVNLRATLDDLDVLVAESKPATKELAPFLRELRPLVAASRPTIRDLRTLIRRGGPDNDLVEATRKMPALQRVATPAFDHGREALVKLQPVLEFIRPYSPEFVGWLRDFGQGASNYDANGHYARIQPIFNAFNFNDNPAGGVLTPIPPSQRFDELETNQLRRCPGAASQPNSDGSAPWRDVSGSLDCDPDQVPPGP